MTPSVWLLVFLIWTCHCGFLKAAEGTDTTTLDSQPFVASTSTNFTFYIEHALESTGETLTFVPRTRIQLVAKADGKHGILYLDRNTISDSNHVALFKNLIDKKDLYTIRIRTEKLDWKSEFVSSSIPVVL